MKSLKEYLGNYFGGCDKTTYNKKNTDLKEYIREMFVSGLDIIVTSTVVPTPQYRPRMKSSTYFFELNSNNIIFKNHT